MVTPIEYQYCTYRHLDIGHRMIKTGVEFRCLKVVNPMSYLTVGLLENTSRLVDVSLNWTINSTG